MTLYEMSNELLDAYYLIASGQAVDEETGEVDPVVMEQIEMTEKEADKKIESIAVFIKQLKSDAEALKQEKNNLEKRQKTMTNTAERLEQYLLNNMLLQKREYFSTTKARVTIRNSEYVNITDQNKIPKEYIRVKEEVNKVDIKNALKLGEHIDGCELATRKNINIK